MFCGKVTFIDRHLQACELKPKQSLLNFERIKVALVIFGCSVLLGCVAVLVGVPLIQDDYLLHGLGIMVILYAIYAGFRHRSK